MRLFYIIFLHNIMSFTTLNTFNSNLWKGGVIKPTLYGLSIRTTDLNVNSININYQYSGVSYVTTDVIGSSGKIRSEPRYIVTSNPVSYNVTGLNPNTYYNFVIVPYNRNDVSGSTYYFTGFTNGNSTMGNTTTGITIDSQPINYSNLGAPICSLSKINSFTNTYNTTANLNTNNMNFVLSCTDLSYVIISINGNNTTLTKPNGSGSIISFNSTISLPLSFENSTLTTQYTYYYMLTAYNNANISNSISGSYIRPALISSYINGTINISGNYYLITYTADGSITFNNNISNLYTGNVLIVGWGGYVNSSYQGGGGGGAYKNINYIFDSSITYNIFLSGNKDTILKNGTTMIYTATKGGNGPGGNGASGAGGRGGTKPTGAGGTGLDGYNGGHGCEIFNYNNGGGGGGGAGGVGGVGGGSSSPGAGGAGKIWPINGITYAYGGDGKSNGAPGFFIIAFLA